MQEPCVHHTVGSSLSGGRACSTPSQSPASTAMSLPPPPNHTGGPPPRSPAVPRWGLGDVGIAFGVGVATSLVAAIAYPLITGKTDANALKGDLWFTIVAVLAQQIGTAFSCVWLVRTKGSDPRRALGLSIRASDLALIPLGFVFSLAAGAAVAPLQSIGKHHTQEIVTNLNKAQGLTLAIFSLAVLIAAPVGEELLFRGLLLRSLLRRVNPLFAILISAGIFALAHTFDPNALVALPALFAFGVLLAVTAMKTGRLGSSMCLHFGFNALAVLGAIRS